MCVGDRWGNQRSTKGLAVENRKDTDQPDCDEPAKDERVSEDGESSSRLSRRRLLAIAGVGVGAAVAATAPGVAAAREGPRGPDGRCGPQHRADHRRHRVPREEAGPDRFARMFNPNQLSRSETIEMRAALIELSRPGGILDANDPLDVGPVRLITEPELSPGNLDNPRHTAGTTFFGQFLDHDLTRDGGSSLGRATSLRRSVNLRSARLDLDSVYGGGPRESPDLYGDDRVHLLLESGGLHEDLPRDAEGAAIIADPRNDENLMISGLHAGFLRFHNAVVDRHVDATLSPVRKFAEAQRLVRWHYQWIVVHEFLPQIVGRGMVRRVLRRGRSYYTPRRAQIPVEFQTAAYRFGHSMVRPSYRANLNGDAGEPFFALVFDPTQLGRSDPDDLTGGHRATRRFIDWQTFFDFEDGEVKPNKRIDTAISTPLFRIPTSTIDIGRGERVGPTSLATRNLLRHLTWQIPTGQSVAAAMKQAPLTRADLAPFGDFGAGLDRATPLWLYVLREAELATDGMRLGPVGGRIVAEVFIGLLQMDPGSYLAAHPSWRPTLPPISGDRDFRTVDMLTLAGVDPASRAGAA